MTPASAGSPTGARPVGARSRSDNIAVGRQADAQASDNTPAILSLDSPSLGEGAQDWSFLPKQIGRLELGERPSDNECYCSDGHVIPDGAPLYWPQGMGQYDDRNAYCLEHAIEQAESDSGWCEKCIAADLAAEAHTPTTNAPVADEIPTSILERAWTNFLDANPDDINSPEEWPDHALVTCDQMIDIVRNAEAERAEALSLTKNVATNADMRGAANASAGIFDHKWLDPSCVAKGCQSLANEPLRANLERTATLIERNVRDGDGRMALENCAQLIALIQTGATINTLSELRSFMDARTVLQGDQS